MSRSAPGPPRLRRREPRRTLPLPAAAGAYYGNAADSVDGAQLVSADYARLEQGDDTTGSPRSPPTGATSRSRPAPATSSPTTIRTPPATTAPAASSASTCRLAALVKVADGDLFRESDNAFLRRGASNPSISADGRFVAFSTGQRLVPADDNDNVDVYVRDMSRPPAHPAPTTSSPPATGAKRPRPTRLRPFPSPAAIPAPRSPAASRSAPTATGSPSGPKRESDLPASLALDTPAGQIFVRDRDGQTTTLVTAARKAETGLMSSDPAGGALGAALSADGTTVAWTGRNAAAQTRFLAGENTDPSFNYYLWRRAPFGPDEPTRRITGLSDPDDPVCRQGRGKPRHDDRVQSQLDRSLLRPADRPGGQPADISSQLPALSGDGYTVAFLTGAGPRPARPERPGSRSLPHRHEARRHPQAGHRRADPRQLDRRSRDQPAAGQPGDVRRRALSRAHHQPHQIRPAGPAADSAPRARCRVRRSSTSSTSRAARSSAPPTRSSAATSTAASRTGDDLRATARGSPSAPSPAISSRRRQPADRRVRRHPPGRTGRRKSDRGRRRWRGRRRSRSARAGPRVIVRAKAKADGVVVLTITVPAAGKIKAVAVARTAGRPSHARSPTAGRRRPRQGQLPRRHACRRPLPSRSTQRP